MLYSGICILLAVLLCVSLAAILAICCLACREMDARLRTEQRCRRLRREAALLAGRLARLRYMQEFRGGEKNEGDEA
ncbi:MAG TPA: hypothetical protein H9668_04895 [Firmicutes bacterium]|nr:hypothetical protein [Bacillota bacterium]